MTASRFAFPLFAILAACGSSPPPAPPAKPLDVPPVVATADAGAPAPAPASEKKPAVAAEVTLSEACIPLEARTRINRCGTGAAPTRMDLLNAEQAANNEQDPASKSTKAQTEKVRLARKTPRPLHAKELAVAGAYVCANPSDLDSLYEYARMHFELQDWEGASLLFAGLTNGPPAGDATIYAAQLMLEALNILAGTFERAACWADMEAAVPTIRARLCTDAVLAKTHSEEACDTLVKIQDDLAKRKKK